jgi:hypothetical protein
LGEGFHDTQYMGQVGSWTILPGGLPGLQLQLLEIGRLLAEQPLAGFPPPGDGIAVAILT